MKLRAAVFGAVLVLTPTAAVGDTTDGAAIINLLEAEQAPMDDAGSSPAQPQSSTNSDGADYELLTAPLEADTFFVAGVTWEGASPDSVDIRVLEQDVWGSWYSLEIEDGEGGRDGTEPFIAGGAEGVQVRVSADVLPTDLTLALADGEGGQEADEAHPSVTATPPTPGTELERAVNADDVATEPSLMNEESPLPATESATSLSGGSVPAPEVINRRGWGEPRVPPVWTPSYAKLGGAVIHHTAGTNSYTERQAPAVVRSIHNYHTYSWGRGWDDIGYNFLVDRFGNIYEGRYGTLASASDTMVVGGHAAPANTGSVGISVMGNYTGSVRPTAESMAGMEDIIAWQFSQAGVNPKGSWTFYNYRTGRNVTVPAILGHRDVSSTACPGNIYSLLPNLRNTVSAKIDAGGKPVRGDNDYVIHKTNDFSPIANGVQYFGKSGDEIYVGNVLGRGDLPFIRRGNIFTFAQGPTSPTTTRSHTLGSAGQEVYTGDIEGTGREAVILRTGNRFDIYEDASVNRPTRSINFGRASDEVYVFDWDGDGKDELAVRRGNQFYLKWMVTSGPADREINYGRVDDEVLVGSWASSSAETITLRRGNTYYMKYSIASGPADKVFDYGRPTDSVVVGDWDADGLDGVGVIRDLSK